MNLGRNQRIALLAIISLAFVMPAASVSADAPGQTGVSSQGDGVINRYAPDIDLGGMLAVTSTQQGERTTRNDEIIVNHEADFSIDKVCAQTDWKVWEDKTYHDVSVWLTFKSNSGDTGEVLKLKQVGSVKEGECLSVSAKDVLVRDSVMYNGEGNYDVEADLVTFDDNTNANIITGQQDTGEIRLITSGEEGEEAKTPRGSININPVAEKEQEVVTDDNGNLIREGDWAKVEQGTEITFKVEVTQGKVGEVEFGLYDIENVPEILRFHRETDTEDPYKFTYTFDNPGAIQVNANLEPEHYNVGSFTQTRQFFVMSQDNEVPNARLEADSRTVKEGEDVYLTLENSNDPDGEIRWKAYKWESPNGLVTKTGDEARFNFDNPGTYHIKGEVTDHQGATDTQTVAIKVEEDPNRDDDEGGSSGNDFCEMYPEADRCSEGTTTNKPPVAEGIDAPTEATTGEVITAKAQVTDRDDDNLDITWSNGDTGQQTTYDISGTSNIQISFTVTDDDNAQDRTSTTVAVSRKDSDNDGIIDVQDSCPNEPGQRSDGCPYAPQPAEQPVSQLDQSFQNEIGQVVETSGFLNFLNAAGSPQQVSSNEVVERNLRAGTTSYDADTNYQDGSYTAFYAKDAVIYEGNATQESDWKPLNQEPMYEKTFSQSFDEGGNRAYYITVYEARMEYDHSNETWEATNVRNIDSSKYLFEVEGSSSGGDDPECEDCRGGGFVPEGGLFGSGSSATLALLAVLMIVAVGGYIVYQKRKG